MLANINENKAIPFDLKKNKYLQMKKLIALLVVFPLFATAQTKDCEYDLEEKTDSTSLKVMPNKLIHEKIFGNSNEFVFFSLINENGAPILNLQLLRKSQDFIAAYCLNKNSKIIFQLENGKIISLINVYDETCSELNFDPTTNNNIRILNGFFYFTKTNYEELKNSPISLMRIQFAGETKDYVLKKLIFSEILLVTSNPASYFMEYLKCVE